MARERHQHLERSQMELRDQHGRLWLAESEVSKTGHDQKPRQMPCGPLSPAFAAPHEFYPPAHVLYVDHRRPGQVTVLYEAWLMQQRTAHKDYQTQLGQFAGLLYGQKSGDALKRPTPELLSVAGTPPRPIEPIIACMQGNRYALGLTDKVDPRIEPFLEQDAEMRRSASHGLIELDLEDFDFGEAEEEPEEEEEEEKPKGRKAATV